MNKITNIRWPKNPFGKHEKPFFVGFNSLNGRPINLSEEEFKKHWHFLGATGKGKTKYIEHFTRMLIEQKQGLCLIDPHGDLYEEMTKFVVRKRLEDRVILLDPNQDNCLFGLNYLERGAHIVKEIDAHVNLVMRAIGKVFGGENQDALPRLQHWERNTLHALMDQGLTMVEMLDFLSLTDPKLRQSIVEKLKDPYITKDWQEFEALRRQEKEIRLESVLNRATKFLGNERIRRIVGQSQSTVNFRQAMDEGKIVLVNLSPKFISREAQRMLGVMIVDMVIEAAFSRADMPEKDRKPFYFIVDEFGEFVCDDFAYALETLRKYGVFLMLSNQQMDQLQQESSRVYASVMTNCTNKVVFGISREDAEIMAKELFTGMFRADQIKNIIEQTKFWPTETTRTIRSSGSSESSGAGTFSGRSSSHGSSAGQSVVHGPDGPIFLGDVLAQSTAHGSSSASASSHGDSSFSGSAISSAESEVPWYEYVPFKEISSINYFTPEELLEKFISWIKNQGPRQAQIKIDIKKPVPIYTPTIEEVRVRPKDVQLFENKMALLYAKPINQIDLEISERRNNLLSAAEDEAENKEPDDFRE